MTQKRFFAIVTILVIIFILVNYVPETKKRVLADPDDAGVMAEVSYEYVPIVYEQGIAKRYVTEVQEAVVMLPADVISGFVREGWKISLVSEINLKGTAYEDEDSDYMTVGLTDYKNKIIQLRPVRYSGISNFIKLKALHELCHFADSYYGDVTATDEWEALYKEYRDSYVEYEFLNIEVTEKNTADVGYATSDRYEMFACAMKDYLNQPGYLKDNYPGLYGYFDEIVKGERNEADVKETR